MDEDGEGRGREGMENLRQKIGPRSYEGYLPYVFEIHCWVSGLQIQFWWSWRISALDFQVSKANKFSQKNLFLHIDSNHV